MGLGIVALRICSRRDGRLDFSHFGWHGEVRCVRCQIVLERGLMLQGASKIADYWSLRSLILWADCCAFFSAARSAFCCAARCAFASAILRSPSVDFAMMCSISAT